MGNSNRWKLRGACFGSEEPDLWFPTYDTPAEEIGRAKEVCQGCPVMEKCKANRPKNAYGIWGGVLYRLCEGDE